MIVVVGSLNIDLAVEVERRPEKGETLSGRDFHTFPGGKGANQAVAIGRLGETCAMLGCIGEDTNGKLMYEVLQKEGLELAYLKQVEGPNGVAVITLSEQDNSIIVVPGANQSVTVDYIEANRKIIEAADLVVTQLEIPLEAVCYLGEMTSKKGIPLILNPAPAQVLPKALIEQCTYLTPNEHECKILFGEEESLEACLKKYPNKLIVTQGAQGVSFYDGKEVVNVPAYKMEVVDTTGAGDTFNGALAYQLAQGIGLREAIDFANLAAGLSVTKLSAQGGMPTLEQIKVYKSNVKEVNR